LYVNVSAVFGLLRVFFLRFAASLLSAKTPPSRVVFSMKSVLRMSGSDFGESTCGDQIERSEKEKEKEK
jgi:hypothetical protein